LDLDEVAEGLEAVDAVGREELHNGIMVMGMDEDWGDQYHQMPVRIERLSTLKRYYKDKDTVLSGDLLHC
jgi:hypothetical protein